MLKVLVIKQKKIYKILSCTIMEHYYGSIRLGKADQKVLTKRGMYRKENKGRSRKGRQKTIIWSRQEMVVAWTRLVAEEMTLNKQILEEQSSQYNDELQMRNELFNIEIKYESQDSILGNLVDMGSFTVMTSHIKISGYY